LIPKAVIVAAGLSSRLYPLTANTPKPLLSLGGESLLARSVRLLRSNGIDDIAVVVGYRGQMIRDAMGSDVKCLANPFYMHCNNMGSLWMAKDFVGADPFVYLHGDLIYGDTMMREFLLATVRSTASVDLLTAFGPVDDEAMKVKVETSGRLIKSSKTIPVSEAQGEWTGIAAIHRPAIVFAQIERHLMLGRLTVYDTASFTSLVSSGEEVRCLPSAGDPWMEIDTIADWESASLEFDPTS
jgi:choline kinase